MVVGLAHGGPLPRGVLGGSPDAYRTAGFRWGTATSTSTRPGTTSDDARTLEKRFAPALSAADLMGLDAYEVAIRPCVDGQTRPPVTGKTVPLPDAVRKPSELARISRERYGVPRTEVEGARYAKVPAQYGWIGVAEARIRPDERHSASEG